MRRHFERIQARLAAFVKQQENVLLVLRTSASDGFVLSQILPASIDNVPGVLSWVALEDFREPRSYVQDVVLSFLSKVDATRALLHSEGLSPWPPVPDAVTSPATDPIARLRALLEFSRRLSPNPAGWTAWVIMPAQIRSNELWAAFIGQLIQHQPASPWCHHLRIYVRDEASGGLLASRLANQPRVEIWQPDMSHEAMDRALIEDANDESLPLHERMSAVLVSANRDYSLRRFSDALTKLGLCVDYFGKLGKTDMLAVCLATAGEVHRRMGNSEQALCCFDEGLQLSSGTSKTANPVASNCLLGIAQIWFEGKHWREAEVAFDGLYKFAGILRDVETRLLAIDNLAHCQYMQGKIEEAIKTWRAGSTAADGLQRHDYRSTMLQKLRFCFAQQKDEREMRRVDSLLAGLHSVSAQRWAEQPGL